MIRHIFIIGSRGLPAKYGGFETFVEQLVKHKMSEEIHYHVACQTTEGLEKHFDYLGADCFMVKVPNIGGAKVMAYDSRAIKLAIKQIADEKIEHPIFYILGNTIGGWIHHYVVKIHNLGGLLFVNPDGLEWRRTKWSVPIRRYLKYAEKKMVKSSDLIISDNKGIEDYLRTEYGKINSQVIAYGTELVSSNLKTSMTLDKFGVTVGEYFLIVGRFVPENNYETIISQFMKSESQKSLVIVAPAEGKFLEELRNRTKCDKDERVKFVGTIYDQNELRFVRENAFAYIHGHEVGGTNPSLLEAMWSSPLNIVLGVPFNKEVAQDSAIYFSKADLTEKINSTEKLINRGQFHLRAQEIILERYTWPQISKQYEELFLES
ncbi:MAG TPA: DUF1972 domain-containing protein [Lactovum miscens]|uniref:beta 1-4 rhamnosyltransferase Cps2T n=1 Tax=Lactovum miscens TaxID=190387 RepID=UPI002ED9D03B